MDQITDESGYATAPLAPAVPTPLAPAPLAPAPLALSSSSVPYVNKTVKFQLERIINKVKRIFKLENNINLDPLLIFNIHSNELIRYNKDGQIFGGNFNPEIKLNLVFLYNESYSAYGLLKGSLNFVEYKKKYYIRNSNLSKAINITNEINEIMNDRDLLTYVYKEFFEATTNSKFDRFR